MYRGYYRKDAARAIGIKVVYDLIFILISLPILRISVKTHSGISSILFQHRVTRQLFSHCNIFIQSMKKSVNLNLTEISRKIFSFYSNFR
jgi:hypothetical protein